MSDISDKEDEKRRVTAGYYLQRETCNKNNILSDSYNAAVIRAAPV